MIPLPSRVSSIWSAQVSLGIVRVRMCVREGVSFGNGDLCHHVITRNMCHHVLSLQCSFAIGTLEYIRAHPRCCIKDLVKTVSLARIETDTSNQLRPELTIPCDQPMNVYSLQEFDDPRYVLSGASYLAQPMSSESTRKTSEILIATGRVTWCSCTVGFR